MVRVEQQAFFVNAELLAASGEPEPAPRQNTPAEALHPQRIPVQNQDRTTVLRLSDAESEQRGFPGEMALADAERSAALSVLQSAVCIVQPDAFD